MSSDLPRSATLCDYLTCVHLQTVKLTRRVSPSYSNFTFVLQLRLYKDFLPVANHIYAYIHNGIWYFSFAKVSVNMAATSTGLDCLSTVKYNGGRAAIHCKLYQFQSSYGYLMGHHQYGPKIRNPRRLGSVQNFRYPKLCLHGERTPDRNSYNVRSARRAISINNKVETDVQDLS